MCKATRVQARRHAHRPARAHTHIHTQKYVLLIAFLHQHLFRERATVLRYVYIASVVIVVQMFIYILQNAAVSTETERTHWTDFRETLYVGFQVQFIDTFMFR